MTRKEAWHKKRDHTKEDLELALKALQLIKAGDSLRAAVRKFPLSEGRGFLAKHTLVAAYHQMIEDDEWGEDPELLARIRMKPVRTLSGVTTKQDSPCYRIPFKN